MYCVYDYAPGERLTQRLVSIAQEENEQNRKILVSQFNEDVKKFSNLLSDLGFYCSGLTTDNKLTSDNIIVDLAGHWWITDLDAIGTINEKIPKSMTNFSIMNFSIMNLSYSFIYDRKIER
jgi:hypothetical protein